MAIWCIDSEKSESERCEKTRELTSGMTVDAFGAHHTIADGFIVGRVDPCSLVRREPSTDCDFVKEYVVSRLRTINFVMMLIKLSSQRSARVRHANAVSCRLDTLSGLFDISLIIRRFDLCREPGWRSHCSRGRSVGSDTIILLGLLLAGFCKSDPSFTRRNLGDAWR